MPRPFLLYTEPFDGPNQFTQQGAQRRAIWLIVQAALAQLMG
jgi:hypothetical protein